MARKRKESVCRCRQIRDKIPVTFIICEGRGEEVYFKRFNRRDRRIIPYVSPHKRADLLVQYTIDLIDSHQIDRDKCDNVWCIFDRDDNTDQDLQSADQLAAQNHFIIAYSNPCFEIWLYWHFKGSMQHWSSSQALKGAMREEIPEYHETGNYSLQLRPLFDAAEQRAQQARETHKRNGIRLHTRAAEPVTEIDILVRKLL